jgi:hypothetical protein
MKNLYFLITYHPSIMVQWLGVGGQNEQTPTDTIHWMSIMTQLWMNLNCNNTWFHLWESIL